MFDCSDCNFTTDTKRGLSVHRASAHDSVTKVEFTCRECGDTFKDYKSRRSAKGENNNFCSRGCKDEFERNGEEVECSWCGDNIYRAKSLLDKMGDYPIDNHFCDKECEQSWKRQRWTGDGHPSWRGGSPTHRGKSWPEMRRKALDRGGYSCGVCGMTREEHYDEYGIDLDVHHKIPSATFDEVDDANYLLNLVTTCRSCHGKLEQISRTWQDNKLVV